MGKESRICGRESKQKNDPSGEPQDVNVLLTGYRRLMSQPNKSDQPKTGFGKRLQEARKKKGLSQTQLGELTGGHSKQTVSSWEKERTEPDLWTIRELCILLGVTADHLIRGKHPLTKEQRDAVLQALDFR